ncbi:PREDICTED: uncharacterized protein LOC108612780 [Drosophila arizonae]|uniref:Uncharacterized protein LOC108612780 n=1 Tax=Drosophila arizonae TaxID=7263 RepID=A0ABM1P232_DROAR|nr:PREDICTED: uncharacterized protein LOC108612780 [Drosophila arizonae]
MDELASQLPKIYTRNVLSAIARLQNGQSAYVCSEEIVGMVAKQMRRKRDIDTVKDYVLKSLDSLIELGVLIRNPKSNYNFYKFPDLTTYECLTSVKRRNYYSGGRKPYYRPKKPIAAKPKRQRKGKYQKKFKPAIVPVVCNCCRSSVMPLVEAFNEINKNTFDTEKPPLEQLKISDSEAQQSVDHTENKIQRFEFQAPTLIIVSNCENSPEEETIQ